MNGLKFIFLFLFCAVTLTSNAQKMVLTSNGMCSSENTDLAYVEYSSKGLSKHELAEYCRKKLQGMDFFSYQIETYGEEKTTIKGYLDGSSLLIFGKTEIAFQLIIEYIEDGVRVSSKLSKTNGKPLNLGLLFSKKTGKVRVSAPKNKIEEGINSLILKVLDDVVAITN